MMNLILNWIESKTKKTENQKLSIVNSKICFYKMKSKQFPDNNFFKLKIEILKLIKKYIMENEK